MLTTLFVACLSVSFVCGQKTWNMTITPMFHPQVENIRLCQAVKLPAGLKAWIVRIEVLNAQIKMGTAVSACEKPGFEDLEHKYNGMFDCSLFSHEATALPQARDCGEGAGGLVWGWSPGDSQPHLPVGTGIAIGQDVGRGYIVVGSHYVHLKDAMDNKTIVLTLRDRGSSDEGLDDVRSLFLSVYDVIPPHSRKSLESFYRVDQNVNLHPYAFSIHSHAIGSQGRMWVVSPSGNWTLMGQIVLSPGENTAAKTLSPVLHPGRVILRGDRIVLQCLLENPSDVPRLVRSQGDNAEMCFSTLMYHTKPGLQLTDISLVNDNTTADHRGFNWNSDPVLRSHHVEMQPLA